MEETATSGIHNDWPEGVQPLEQFVAALTEQQLTHERQGKYVEAETLRIKVNDSRRELDRRRENEMNSRHRSERMEFEKGHSDEMTQFNNFWDKKAQQLNDEAKRCELEMETRHNEELHQTEDKLQKTISVKYKESSELLNLKKMEEHMAKQKNYVEAHKVQCKITAMDKQESENYTNARNLKIQTALNQLKAKQANELAALRKRISTSRDEQNKDRTVEQQRIMQKYNNVKKELAAQHEKEILAFKGQFRSKASVSSMGSSRSK